MASIAEPEAPGSTARARPRLPLFLPVAAIVIVAGLIARAAIGWDRPLWFDETFTGAFAIQPTLAGLVRDCLAELSGPVYYSALWLWAKLAGFSNLGLRLPSVLLSLGAPLLLLWRGHPDRDTRILWAALAAVSIPALEYSIDARPYSLLFFLGCAQAVLFGQLIRLSTLGYAFGWATVSMLLILTHYHTVPLVGVQGLVYLAVRRQDALRNWPAALAFVPAAIWMPIHLPALLRFSKVAWQDQLSGREILQIPDALLHFGGLSLSIFVLAGGTVAYDLWRSARRKEPFPYDRADAATFAAGVLAVGGVFAVALYTRSFHPRYLIPYVPGILLGLSVWALRWSTRVRVLPAVMAAMFLLFAVWQLVLWDRHRNDDVRRQLAWQRPSADFAAAGVRRLAFFWDHPTMSEGDTALLGRVAGFFYERQGVPVEVAPLILTGRRPALDPNRAIADALAAPAAGGGKSAFIWMYWPHDPHLTRIYPPRLDRWRAAYSCKNYGVSREFVVLGCIER